MNRFLPSTRTAFSRQPAHYLLIDIEAPTTPMNLRNTGQALHNVMSLACSIRGGVRIPAFGLSVLCPQVQNICKLEPIRGHFNKIIMAKNLLPNLIKSTVPSDISQFKEHLVLAIKDIMEEFKAKFESVTGGSSWRFPTQLQITLLTRKSGLEIQEFLEELIKQVPAIKLKKIQVVELSDPELCDVDELFQGARRLSQVAVGFVDLVQLMDTEAQLEEFFKTWLLDCDSEQEHLCLMFPSPAPNRQSFTIKCDINECLINSLSLPFGHHYSIQSDIFSFQLGGAKSSANDLPVYELEVVATLSSSGLCESLLFGHPQRLLPTQCWRLEWTELLSNQQNFSALCQQLISNDKFLLTHLKSNYRTDSVTGYFVIVPGGNNLLIKPVAPSELLLPTRDSERTDEEVPEEVVFHIGAVINSLPSLEEYHPLKYTSGLYNNLGRSLQHNSSLTSTVLYAESTDRTPSDRRYSYPALDAEVGVGPSAPRGRGRGQKRIRSQTNLKASN